MAGKLVSLRQDTPLLNQNISSTTYSSVVDIGSVESICSMQLVWTGGITPNFTVSLEVSNNLKQWVTVGGSSQVLTSVADTLMWDNINSGCEFLRINVTVNSGSATFSAFFNGKVRD